MDKGLQSLNTGFEDLYNQAKESIEIFENVGHSIVSSLKRGAPDLFENTTLEMAPLKTKDRALAKIESDYGGDATQISDLVRGRIVVKDANQIEKLRDFIETHGEKLGMEKVKDQFAKPTDTGFRAINIKMRLSNGHVSEFRVEHEGMVKAAKQTHDPYAQVQTIERKAESEQRMLTEEEAIERQQLLDKVRDIHHEPAQKDGLDRLLNDAGREKLMRFDSERLSPPPKPKADIKFDFSGPDATYIGAINLASEASQTGIPMRQDFTQAQQGVSPSGKASPKFKN